MTADTPTVTTTETAPTRPPTAHAMMLALFPLTEAEELFWCRVINARHDSAVRPEVLQACAKLLAIPPRRPAESPAA